MRLFQLYYNEKETEDIRYDLEKRQSEIVNLESKRDKTEEEVKELKKQQSHETREIAKIEEQIKDAELKLAKKRPLFIKAKESSAHIVKKLDTAKTNYEAAVKANEAHVLETKSIEAELDKLKVLSMFIK